MDVLLQAIQEKKNVAITSMYGLERSRFLLRCSFNILAKHSGAKVYLVLDKDRLVDRVYHESTLMPFSQFGPDGIEVAKLDETKFEGDPKLIICSVTRLYELYEQKNPQKTTDTKKEINVIIFDVTALESLEGAILEKREQEAIRNKTSVSYYEQLSGLTSTFGASSIVLACNSSLEGTETELGLKFDLTISNDCLSGHQQTSGSVVLFGPQGTPMIFGGLNPSKDTDSEIKQRLHSETGMVLEALSAKVRSGGIVVFFPTYGKMVEYHNAWRQSGVFERIGVPYGRENRGGDHFKRGLHGLATQDKSVFLCSIRYHQDDDLAEMVLGQVQLVLIVGLPYPIMGDSWEARIKTHNEDSASARGLSQAQSSPLSGTELYKNRAIDFMNGIIKRCLVNGYRSKPCHFYLLDRELENDCNKLTNDLGKVKEWRL